MKKSIIILSVLLASVSVSYSQEYKKPKDHTNVIDRVLSTIPGAVQYPGKDEKDIAKAWSEEYKVPDTHELYVTCITTSFSTPRTRDLIDVGTEELNYYGTSLWQSGGVPDHEGMVVYIRFFAYPLNERSPIAWRIVEAVHESGGTIIVVCGSTAHRRTGDQS